MWRFALRCRTICARAFASVLRIRNMIQQKRHLRVPFLLFRPWIAVYGICAPCSKDAFGRSAFLKSMLFRQKVHFGCANDRNSMDGLFRLLHFIIDLSLAVSFPYLLVGARPIFVTLRSSLLATAMMKRCAIGGVSCGAVFVSKDASLRAH